MPFGKERWSRGCGTGVGLSSHKNQYRCAALAASAARTPGLGGGMCAALGARSRGPSAAPSHRPACRTSRRLASFGSPVHHLGALCMGGGHRARGWGATVWGGLAPRLGQPSCFESGGGDASRRPAPRGVAARTSLLRTEHPQGVHERPSNQRGGGCCALVAASAQHVARRAASDKRSGGRTLWWGRCGAALPLARRCLVPLHWEAHLSAAGSAQERCEAGGQGAERARSLVTFHAWRVAPGERVDSATRCTPPL